MKKIGIVALAALTLLAGCGKVENTTTTVITGTSSSSINGISSSVTSSNSSLENSSIATSNTSSRLSTGSEVVLTDSSISSTSSSFSVSSQNITQTTNNENTVKNYEVVNNGRVYNLKIPQAGLAINVPSSVANDTYYKVLPSGNGKIIYVYPRSLAESVKACANGEYGIAIKKMPGVAPADLKGAKQLNGFYVTASAPSGECSSNQYEKDFTKALLNNFESVSQI